MEHSIPAYAVTIPRGDGSRTIVWEDDGTAFCMTYAPGQGVFWERAAKYDTHGAPVQGSGIVVWLRDGSTRLVTLNGCELHEDTQYHPAAMLARIAQRQAEAAEAARQAKLAAIESIEEQKRDAAALAKRLEREAKAQREALGAS